MVAEEDAILALMSSVDESVGDDLRGMRNVDEVCGTVVGMLTMPDVPYFFVIGEDPRGGNLFVLNVQGRNVALLTDYTGTHLYEGVAPAGFTDVPQYDNDLMNAGRGRTPSFMPLRMGMN